MAQGIRLLTAAAALLVATAEQSVSAAGACPASLPCACPGPSPHASLASSVPSPPPNPGRPSSNRRNVALTLITGALSHCAG